jgi:hypothetical protein
MSDSRMSDVTTAIGAEIISAAKKCATTVQKRFSKLSAFFHKDVEKQQQGISLLSDPEAIAFAPTIPEEGLLTDRDEDSPWEQEERASRRYRNDVPRTYQMIGPVRKGYTSSYNERHYWPYLIVFVVREKSKEFIISQTKLIELHMLITTPKAVLLRIKYRELISNYVNEANLQLLYKRFAVVESVFSAPGYKRRVRYETMRLVFRTLFRFFKLHSKSVRYHCILYVLPPSLD